MLVVAARLAILLRRILADRQAKQRLLLREAAFSEPVLTLDAVYAPAQEVGCGYLLDGQVVVAGDVSGEGLKAAMVVGVLQETWERAPGAVLGALNRALVGLMEFGFVTCCCVRFESEGKVTVACAGQMRPYLNQVEVAVETGMPLGLIRDAEFAETTLTLGAGQQLTLVSDGVVEAANEACELFGFERTRAAAKTWGRMTALPW